MLIAFGIAEGVLSLLQLNQLLDGAPQSTVLRVLGFGVRFIGLVAVSLYLFKYVRSARVVIFLLSYILLGINAGLILFLVRGAFLTTAILAQKQLYQFDFLKIRDAFIFIGFATVICTSVGVVAYRRYQLKKRQLNLEHLTHIEGT